MTNINDLVSQAKEKLDRTSNSAGLVGNRMHFPMLISYYGNRASSIFRNMGASFDRIWSQTSENIVYIHSSPCDNDNTISLHTIGKDNSKALSKEELQNILDEIRRKRGVFASMLKWCVYNVIDTFSIKDLDEFKNVYYCIEKVTAIIDGSVSSMLILLLDESSSKKDISVGIREFLSKNCSNGLYDGTIVISNKTMRNELYAFEELLGIVSGTIILSNNDSVGSYDDADYKKRVSSLFGGRILTMAYSSLRRPNKKISLQILNVLLDDIFLNYINSNKTITEQELTKRLGIENGKISFIEESIRQLDVQFPAEMCAALPFKELPSKDMDINSIPYNEFCSLLHNNVFNMFMELYCKRIVEKTSTISAIVNQYSLSIKERILSSEIANLHESTIDSIVNMLQVQQPNNGMSLPEYFINYVKYYIKRFIVYPQIRQVLQNLRIQANRTLEEFHEFRKEFLRSLPVDGFNELGTIYSNLTENYFHTVSGEQILSKVIRPGNNRGEFIALLLKAFDNLIEQNEEMFALSFIEEWEKRLNLAGDEVYRRIQTTFERDFEQSLFLFGNYQRNVIPLEVYMCHTSDASGQNQTELYQHLKNAVGASDRTQFVNTGMDDLVEAFRFIDCSGSNILL